MGRLLAPSLVIALCCALPAAASAARETPLQHVTIFGDSVAAAFSWDPTAREVKEVKRLGRSIGPTAVVLIGYNDDPHVYASGIGRVLTAMHRRGVTHVLWLTLRAVNKQYRLINEVIHGASARYRWMTVLDWNSYAHNHPSWFASDGIHLSAAGGVQLAIYIHRWLKWMGLTGRLPA